MAGSSSSPVSGLKKDSCGYDKTEAGYGSTDFWILKVKLSNVLGVYDSEIDNGFVNVYPNPAGTILSIDTKRLNNEVIRDISILDTQGKLLLHKECERNSTQDLTISDLPNGIYFLKISTATKQLSKKVSVIH